MNISRAVTLGLTLALSAPAQVKTEVPPVEPGARPVAVDRIKIHGTALEGNLEGNAVDRDVLVFLPPGYATDTRRRYPVVYGLHGYSIGAEQWSKEIHVPQTIEGAFAKGAQEMIVVLPDSKTVHNGSMYSSSVTTGDFERFISRDVVAYIDAHYRTIARRTSRGLVGHSMGGYGASRIGMRHPEVFGSLYIMSPCCMSPRAARPGNPEAEKALEAVKTPAGSATLPFMLRAQLATAAAWSPNPKNPPLYLDLPIKNGEVQPDVLARWTANAPLAFVHQYIGNLKQYRAIAMDVGDQDGLKADAARLHGILDTYGVANAFEVYPGTHTSAVATRFQNYVMPFFAKNLTGDTGIVIQPAIERPARARKLQEKDFAGYLLVYFKDQTQSAYMAISRDGYTFTDLNNGQPVFDGALLAEQKGVRDPHITRGPDGAFYLAMTDLHIFGQRAGFRATQWERPVEQYGWGNNRALVLMKSWDLIHWTHSGFRVDKAFPELGDLSASWAPQTIYDEKKRKMMVYFTIRFGPKECKLYYSYTDDAFTKLETRPELLPEAGGIDGDLTRVGDKFHLFYVSDAKVKHGVSNRINRGYQFEPRRIDPETVATEAPNVFKRLGTNTYVLMYDVYGARPNNMGFSETTDFVAYKNLGHFNEGVMKGTNFTRPKHGAVTYLTMDELKSVAAHWKVDIKLD